MAVRPCCSLRHLHCCAALGIEALRSTRYLTSTPTVLLDREFVRNSLLYLKRRTPTMWLAVAIAAPDSNVISQRRKELLRAIQVFRAVLG